MSFVEGESRHEETDQDFYQGINTVKNADCLTYIGLSPTLASAPSPRDAGSGEVSPATQKSALKDRPDCAVLCL